MQTVFLTAVFLLVYIVGVICGRKSVTDEAEEYEKRIADLKEEMRIMECNYGRRVKDMIMERELLRGQITELKRERDMNNGKGGAL